MFAALVRDAVAGALKKHGLVLQVLLWSALLAVAWWRIPSSVDNVTVESPVQAPVDMPYVFKNGKGAYTFKATLHQGLLAKKSIVLRVDDCVESVALDGQEFFSSKCTQCDHCPGTRLALPEDVSVGDHTLLFKVKDHGGQGNFALREAAGLSPGLALLIWLAGVVLLFLAKVRGTGPATAWVPMAAMLLVFVYGMMTDPYTRQHDVDGHREYVEHMLSKHTIPGVKQGWETWQPPFYYSVAALFVAGTRLVWETQDIFLRVQAMSALLYVLAVCVAALYWRRFNFNPRTGWLGLAVFAFIPAHVFISARVNNDALTPLWGMLVTILAWEYSQRSHLRTVFITSGVLLLALITKTSALSLVAGSGLCLMVVDHMNRRPLVDRLVRMAIMGAPMLCWMAFWMNRNHTQTGEWLYVNAQLQDSLKVANTAFKYLWFDVRAFLSEGSFNTFGGKMRESFPTALAASSLSGEFGFEFVGSTLLTFLRASALPLLAAFLVGVVSKPATWNARPWLPALMVFGGHAFFMASYNWRYSYACNEDARLWGPAYFPASVMLSWGYERALAVAGPRSGAVLTVAPFVFLAMLAAFYQSFLMF